MAQEYVLGTLVYWIMAVVTEFGVFSGRIECYMIGIELAHLRMCYILLEYMLE